MITKLKFKNWRSLRDVEIDLAPITVFIGANSSGKTNILDALHFWRYAVDKGIEQAVNAWRLRQRVLSYNADAKEGVHLEIAFRDLDQSLLTEEIQIQWHRATLNIPFVFNNKVIRDGKTNSSISQQDIPSRQFQEDKVFKTFLDYYLRFRTQILNENFIPPISLPSNEIGDSYILEGDARNTIFILDFMQQLKPKLFQALQEDLQYMLGYVNQLDTERSEIEASIQIVENSGAIASTISAGTRRLIAMLTAFYALDMDERIPFDLIRSNSMSDLPGLVVIEEPDTALNPGLLRKFVEQIRYYVNDDKPRQVIFTTHNPQFLNYFEPEEVRVVERDENGYTTVNPISPSIREIWLDEFALGEVWMTNSFGGKS